MAWTAIKALNFRLDVSVNYVLDKEKTVLYSAIGYALNSDKTEQSCFETGHLCRLRHAYEDMTDTKRRYGKTDGIQGYHMVQSFAQGEVTPEQAHAIGVEFAKHLLGNEYEAVISTHLNTNHYHNHIVFNSVSLTTGKKYRSNTKTYYTQIRRLSDDICREQGLSIIEPSENGVSKHYAEILAERNGQPTMRSRIREDIEEVIGMCAVPRQLYEMLMDMGYEYDGSGKHAKLRLPSGQRFIRINSLGPGYTEDDLKKRIAYQWPTMKDYREQPEAEYHYYTIENKPRPAIKLKGLRALYFHYLYLIGALPKNHGHKMTREEYLILRNDIRELDKRIAMNGHLIRNNIATLPELHERRDAVSAKLRELTLERKRYYNNDPDSERIQELNDRIKPLRKEIRLCNDIEAHSVQIRERLRQVRELKKETEYEHRHKRKHKHDMER